MKTNIIIRDYKPDDFEEVMAIWKETGVAKPERGDTPEMIEKTLKSNGKLFILEDLPSKKIIGTIWLTIDGRRTYLHHLAVKPEEQKNGYGTILLKESLNYAKTLGLQVKLETHRESLHVIKMCEQLGFEYLGDYNVYILRNLNNIKK